MNDQSQLSAVYRNRFLEEAGFRTAMWQILNKEFFQAYISPDSTVVEFGAGYCEFINSIQARRKIAVDVNPDMPRYASPEVVSISSSSTSVQEIEAKSVDVVFSSNFFEHLPKQDILLTIREAFRILKSGGKYLILQPNFPYCYRDYYRFFDHLTPIDARGLAEAFESSGFVVQEIVPQFLPYTTKSSIPHRLWMIKLYLKLPVLWKIFGGQAFIRAQKINTLT
jgi:ubiquinone/menaquinone biosynthesis C-methylase UbiE